MGDGNSGLTARLGSFIADTDAKKIPDEAFEHAKVAFLDWVAVTVAGKDEPLVRKLIDYANAMGGNEQADDPGARHEEECEPGGSDQRIRVPCPGL